MVASLILIIGMGGTEEEEEAEVEVEVENVTNDAQDRGRNLEVENAEGQDHVTEMTVGEGNAIDLVGGGGGRYITNDRNFSSTKTKRFDRRPNKPNRRNANGAPPKTTVIRKGTSKCSPGNWATL